jgi:addiction module RelB/DinJ family antitoxin
MNAQATEEFRCRIDRDLVRETKRVAREIGTTPGEIVRLLFAQVVKQRAIPFRLQADSPATEAAAAAKRHAEPRDSMMLLDRDARNKVWRELDDSEGW